MPGFSWAVSVNSLSVRQFGDGFRTDGILLRVGERFRVPGPLEDAPAETPARILVTAPSGGTPRPPPAWVG